MSSDEEAKLPRVTVLLHPRKSTSWGIYFDGRLVCFRLKGQGADPVKRVLPLLAAAGHLPLAFAYQSYVPFSVDMDEIDRRGRWPGEIEATPTDGSAGAVRVYRHRTYEGLGAPDLQGVVIVAEGAGNERTDSGAGTRPTRVSFSDLGIVADRVAAADLSPGDRVVMVAEGLTYPANHYLPIWEVGPGNRLTISGPASWEARGALDDGGFQIYRIRSDRRGH